MVHSSDCYVALLLKCNEKATVYVSTLLYLIELDITLLDMIFFFYQAIIQAIIQLVAILKGSYSKSKFVEGK